MIARAALLLSVSLLMGAGSADQLTETAVGAIKLKVPGAWARGDLEGGTVHFGAPSGEAYFDVDVSQVQRKGGMPADECLGKIVAGLGKGFTRTRVGGQPAASREQVITNDEGQRFVSRTYVGCNGMTTWSVVFNMVEARRDRFAPLADQVFRSVGYLK